MARGTFHFGAREFNELETRQILLEEINPKGNFHIEQPVTGFRLPSGLIMVNGRAMSGAMMASMRDHFKADVVFPKGKWIWFPALEEKEINE